MANDINKLKIGRDQLAKFAPDNDTLKRLEKLFSATASLSPGDIQTLYMLIGELTVDLGGASSRGNAVTDSLTYLANSIQEAVSRQAFALPRSIALDYLDYDLTPNFVPQPGRVCWSAADDTLNIHHSGGVVQQVGQETYARIKNNTGATFPNGCAVGISPATSDYVAYIANGTLPSLNIVGITTESIASGALGRVTVFGVVNGVDTSGTPYGETWVVGDILYVSTTIAGGFTKVKPTAPNQSIPIAQVVSVDTLVGQVAVRPVPDQQKYYGQFSKNTDQAPVAANTAYAVLWTTAGIASGVTMGTPTSRVVVANAGLYRFNASMQLTSSSSTVKNVWVWYRKNGVDVPNSALITSLDSGTAIRAPSRSILLSMAANDYIEVMFASDSINITVDAVPATTFAPAAPAALISVSQEQQ